MALLGASLETLHIAQAVAAALGLVAVYLLVRRFASVGFALITTAAVAAFLATPFSRRAT